MAAEILVLFVFPLLLALAAGWDIASFTIPNFLQVALIASFVAFVVATGMTTAGIGGHLIAGFLGLVVGFTLFALGYIGGGDAKLFACIALWLGFRNLPEYALMASIVGGAADDSHYHSAPAAVASIAHGAALDFEIARCPRRDSLWRRARRPALFWCCRKPKFSEWRPRSDFFFYAYAVCFICTVFC